MSRPTSHSAQFAHRSASFAWNAATFGSSEQFSVELDDSDRAHLRATTDRWENMGRPAVGLCRPEPGSLGTLEPKLAAAAREVREGRGFVVLRGLPTDRDDLARYRAAVWAIGTRFGHALSQNAQGEMITDVIDATAVDPTPRMYRSNMELRPHTDITAMISLASWQRGASGGASVIVSGVAVHDAIRARAPHLLERLYRGYHYHRLGEEGEGEASSTETRVPVFANVGGEISVRYLRSNIAAGHKDLGIPLEPEDLEALNLFDAVATAPENRLAFFLERGEMLVANNYTVMHARTRFTNHPEPQRVRRLVRMWLDAPAFRNVPASYNFYRGNGVPPQLGKAANFDFRHLYANDPVATGGVADLKVTDEQAAAAR